ncbi:MAG: hypothetical protein V3T72_08440 [Thermoanaerobaculia bacterium]
MSTKAKHLLHLAAVAIFLYVLAVAFEGDQAPVAFFIFLVAGMIAELGFWVRLFKAG